MEFGRFDNIKAARAAVLEDLKKRFKENDKNVAICKKLQNEKSQNCYAGAGSIGCPVCKSGKIAYSRSPYNGHVSAVCSTNSCVCWAE